MLESNKTISIVIPNLHSPVIDKTLLALREQSHGLEDVEVIVVGMDRYNLVQPDQTVCFIRTAQPLCAAAARNLGIRQAQGQILVFLDADCVPSHDWLDKLMSFYDKKQVDIVAGGVAFPANAYWTLADNISNFYSYLSSALPGERQFLLSLNLSMKKSVLEKVGGFDESFPGAAGEDSDLTIRIRLAGYHLRFEPSAFVYHCPMRNNFFQFARRSFIFGQTTIKVYRRYQSELNLPIFRRHALLLLLLAPILGALVTVKIFLENKKLLKYWYTIPAVFINKLLWRVGGAYQIWTENKRRV